MHIEQFFDDDLAQYSYAIACLDTGEVAIIDPLRDIDRYIDWADAQGWRITNVAETHIHADFLCGARELAAATGARMLVSGEEPPSWKYQNLSGLDVVKLEDGDEFDVGTVSMRVIHTPGHTPEHITYAIVDDDGMDRFVFTGDFMFVEDLGRPDLLEKAAQEKDAAQKSARQMFDALTSFVDDVPPEAIVWPGHGAGSACGKSMSSVPVSSVGRESRASWWSDMITDGEQRTFIAALLEDQPEVPHYFGRMKVLNRDGMEILGGLRLPKRLNPDRYERLVRDDAVLVDVAATREFSSNFADGAYNLPLSKLSSYAGWLLRPEDSIVLMCEPDQVELATRKLLRVGFDRIEGWVPRSERRVTERIERIDAEAAHRTWRNDRAAILDVRSQSEYDDGHIPGATHIHFGKLRGHIDELDRSRSYVVHCGTGTRATVAASLMYDAGFDDAQVFPGGLTEWENEGYELED